MLIQTCEYLLCDEPVGAIPTGSTIPMRRCFLCGATQRIERHHLFGAAHRDLSEELGLVVDLCAWCHREGPDAAHRSAETMQLLHEYGQRMAMREQGWTADEFRIVFGKNYL